MLKFVTSNRHKFLEAKNILKEWGIEIEWVKLEYEEPRGDDVLEVVKGSLRMLKGRVKGDFFIEDSGLFVHALNGFPGPYSGFFFKKVGYQGLLKLLEGEEDRRAVFRCAIALFIGGKEHYFEGECHGMIAKEARGTGGFGYDPVFIPSGHNMTFAESPEIKEKVSHRRKALEKMASFLKSRKIV